MTKSASATLPCRRNCSGFFSRSRTVVVAGGPSAILGETPYPLADVPSVGSPPTAEDPPARQLARTHEDPSTIASPGASPVTLPPLQPRTTIPRGRPPPRSDKRDFERQEPGYKHKSLSDATRQFVKKHNWPGNVRRSATRCYAQDEPDDHGKVPSTARRSAGSGRTAGGRGDDVLERPLGEGFSLEELLLDEVHRRYRRAVEEARASTPGARACSG